MCFLHPKSPIAYFSLARAKIMQKKQKLKMFQ